MLMLASLLMLIGLGAGSVAFASSAADHLTFEVSSHQVVGVDTSATQTTLQIDACAAAKLERVTTKNVGKVLRVTLDGIEVTRAMVQAGIRGGRIVFVMTDERVASALKGKPPTSAEREPENCR
jgi:preprotein translocase subunit SecD